MTEKLVEIDVTICGKFGAKVSVSCLDDLLTLLNSDDVEIDDMTSLPTFGGDEPDDTTAIWSWDAESLLIGESSPFEIVSRDEE